MNRTSAVAVVAILITSAALAQRLDGSWSATRSEKNDSVIQMNLNYATNSQYGNTMPLSALSGLTRAHVDAAQQTPVTFELRREAGTIAFDGVFRNGKGAGHFAFTPNRDYEARIRSLGLELDSKKQDRQLFQLAMTDVSTSYIRSMRAAGYDVPLSKYMEMRIFDITPEYVQEMRALGYNLSAGKLVETKIHRVTPDYIRSMRAAGWNDSIDDLVQNRIFNVTPEFAAEMKRYGYGADHDDLVQFRIHKVTPEFIKELADLGYTNIPADRLVEMRIHRVTPDFIRELRAAGYKNVPVRKLIDMRIHNIDVELIDKMSRAQ